MARVRVYTTAFCGYCVRAKRLLTSKHIPFEEISVEGDPEGRSQLVKMAGGRRTVPQIFVGDVHVGGYDALAALDRAGGLAPLLEEQGISVP